MYGAAQPFLVYAAKYMDDRTTLPTVIMRTHFPGVSRLRLENGLIVDSKTVQRSALCRSRRELSNNEYLLAKFGFDTAENEPI